MVTQTKKNVKQHEKSKNQKKDEPIINEINLNSWIEEWLPD